MRELKERWKNHLWLLANFTWPHHDLSTWLQNHHQRRITNQLSQVAQLCQVQLCLCSLLKYGKYYCSLLPLTLLCWCIYSSFGEPRKWPKLTPTDWGQMTERDPSSSTWSGPLLSCRLQLLNWFHYSVVDIWILLPQVDVFAQFVPWLSAIIAAHVAHEQWEIKAYLI